MISGTTVRPSTVAPQPIFFTAPQEVIVHWGQPFQLTCFTLFPDISKLNGHIVWCKNEIVFRNQTLGISFIYISIWLMIRFVFCALMYINTQRLIDSFYLFSHFKSNESMNYNFISEVVR